MSLNDDLANDRTYLAWLRTGIALFGLGFVVSKIAYLINSDPKGISDRDLYSIILFAVRGDPDAAYASIESISRVLQHVD